MERKWSPDKKKEKKKQEQKRGREILKIFDDFGVTLAGGRFCRLGVPGDAPEMPWNALGCPGFPNIAIATSIGSATEENATKKTD